MGHEANERGRRRLDNVHIKRLFAGGATAEEVHRQLAFPRGAKCYVCGSKAVGMRVRVFVEKRELMIRSPERYALLLGVAEQLGMPDIPTTPMRFGAMVLMLEKESCDLCAKRAEQEAAALPSYALVEIDRGPGKERTVVQVPVGREE